MALSMRDKKVLFFSPAVSFAGENLKEKRENHWKRRRATPETERKEGRGGEAETGLWPNRTRERRSFCVAGTKICHPGQEKEKITVYAESYAVDPVLL